MPRFNAAEAGSNSSEAINVFISRKESNLPHVVAQQLKGSIYDTHGESQDVVQERVLSQTYREIIITIAQEMGEDISDTEVLELSNIPGLSFRNIPQVVEAYFNSKQT